MSERTCTRRRILREAARLGLGAVGAAALPGLVARSGRAEEACGDPASLSAEALALRRSFHYRARTPEGSPKACRGCEYFVTRPVPPEGCGDCAMLHGIVDVAGTCDAFSEAG